MITRNSLCAGLLAFLCILVATPATTKEFDKEKWPLLLLALQVNSLPCPEIKQVTEVGDDMKVSCGQVGIDAIDPRLIYRVRLNPDRAERLPIFFVDPW